MSESERDIYLHVIRPLNNNTVLLSFRWLVTSNFTEKYKSTKRLCHDVVNYCIISPHCINS